MLSRQANDMTTAKTQVSSLRTVGAFIHGRACSDTLLHVLHEAYGSESRTEERAAMPFAGGIMQHGYQCGMIWGATLAAGAEAYRRFGPGPEAEAKAIHAARLIFESFRAMNGETNCYEITQTNKDSSKVDMLLFFVVKGGTIRCFRRAGRYAPAAYEAIERALADDVEVPESPLSCAAIVARKMGASEKHAVMAAGLAGGIGFSGGGCGALGASIWLRAMKKLESGARDVDYKDPEAYALIDAFLKASGHELECSAIVGKLFSDPADHARYLRDGGCKAVVEVLAM